MSSPIGPRDADHVLRDGACDLTADELNTAFTLLGGNHRDNPLSLYVLVPEVSACDSLKVTVRTATDGKEIEVTHVENIDECTTLPFLLELPLPFSSDTSWQYDLNVTGSCVDMGAVQVWVALASEEANVPAA